MNNCNIAKKLHLLRRPQQLLATETETPGLHNYWKAKRAICKLKRDILPRISFNVECSVVYSNLLVEGKYQIRRILIPLVQICYIESKADEMEVRGISFRLTIKGINNVLQVRDALRFLVVRQRIPHCILGLPFEWQHQTRADVVAAVKNQALITCFNFRYFKNLFFHHRKFLLTFNSPSKDLIPQS